MITQQMQNDVHEFMTAFGQPTNYPSGIPKEVHELRTNLILEEIEELREAFYKTDPVEIADALTDIVYVTLGYRILLTNREVNIPPAAINPHIFYNEAHAAVFGGSLFYTLVSASPENYCRTTDLILTLVNELAALYRIPLQQCWDEVHASNMSKLGADGKPIYREDGKVLKGPNYFKPDLEKIIYDNKD